MMTFEDFKLNKQLHRSVAALGFETPTPIQEEAFPVIMSGKDVVGIAQTGTGKTLAYMLPLLQQLEFSEQLLPRILVLVPTRELVQQVVEDLNRYTQYQRVRVLGVYGEANINLQKQAIAQGLDILVATPGRLYDLVLHNALNLKAIKKLVIDEVDVMLDLGFRPQLVNLFELLPARRQNLLFSATMTGEVDALLDDFFVAPTRISITPSGTPLHNILQQAYPVRNFYTKVNLLQHLLQDVETYRKVLVFVSQKKVADRLFETLESNLGPQLGIIHSNKTQNARIRAVEEFEQGSKRVLIATDVISRGLDLSKVSHVISFDTPAYPENYIHRIGRTGRASQQGASLLFFTPEEAPAKAAIESLMGQEIPLLPFPEEVPLSDMLSPEEKPKTTDKNYLPEIAAKSSGPGVHEKKEKNKKVNLGGSYKRKIAEKYKKPITKGDKFKNKGKKSR